MRNPLKHFPIIRQTGMMECGTTCLAMIFKHYGYHDVTRFLSEAAGVDTEGVDLYTLSKLAEKFGFEADGYKMSYENLFDVQLPFIAHFENYHFVVVYKATQKNVWIADPAGGKYKLTKKEFEEKWNGIALILQPTPEVFQHNELTELAEKARKRDQGIFKKFYLSSVTMPRRGIIFILVGTLIVHLLGLTLPMFTQTIIDHVLVFNNMKLLYAILLSMIIMFISLLLIRQGRNQLMFQFRIEFERSFFSKFFKHFVRLRQSYFDRHKREDLINRFQENIKIKNSLSPALLESLLNFVFSIVYISVLISYHTTLGLFVAAFVVGFLIITILLTPRMVRLNEQSFEEGLKSMGMFVDTLLGIQTVRLLGIERLKYHKWRNKYTLALNKELKSLNAYVWYTTLINTIYLFGQVFIYWYGALMIFEGELTIGSYVAFTVIFMMVMNFVQSIADLEFEFVNLSVSFKKMNDVLAQETIDQEEAIAQLPKEPFNIRMENISFKYLKRSQENTLKNISLNIESGKFTGIAGRNGSGKSTLIKLLCRLYDEYEGQIFLGDFNLKDINERNLRKRISVIPQDTFVFDGTLRENIQYGNLHATDNEILEAIEKADLMPYVKRQYLGLNTRIGENGQKTSGGEQLKIAFARLFVSDPELIILDEASSALDIQTEKKIMENVRAHFKGKTIISIAHRLHTLVEADTIIVMEDGQIAESGSHKDLLQKDGLYNQFIQTYVPF